MKTTRFIPLQVGRVRLKLEVTIIDPDDEGSDDAKTAARGGKGRLPEKVRASIEAMLKAGKRVAEIHAETCVSEPTIYIMRTRMRKEGLLPVQAFGRTAPGRTRGRRSTPPEQPADFMEDESIIEDEPDFGERD